MAPVPGSKLQALQATAAKAHAQWKKACEAQVARWQWASADAWFLEPLFAERMNAQAKKSGWAPLFKKARLLSEAPASPRYGTMQYGHDRGGRVVVARQYVSATDFSERFFAWRDKAVEWVSFNDRHWPDQCGEAELDDAGRVVETRSGERVARFTWRDGVLVRAEVQHSPASKPLVETGEELASALHAEPARTEKPGALLAKLEPLVVDAAVEAFGALRLKEPAYCLIVSFAGPGDELFPPLIGVGLERERRALLEQKQSGRLEAELHEVLWHVGDFEHYPRLQLADEALVKEANRSLLGSAAWKAACASFARVAATLRERKWAPVTDDFVVAAIDFEGATQWAGLKRAAGARQYAAWKREGWVK
jgi:hypothetical protein